MEEGVLFKLYLLIYLFTYQIYIAAHLTQIKSVHCTTINIEQERLYEQKPENYTDSPYLATTTGTGNLVIN